MPLAMSQLILSAVCVTVEMFPSAVSIRVVMEVMLWEERRNRAFAFSMRVSKPLTVCESEDTAPSASAMRVSNPPTVRDSSETAPSAVLIRRSKPETVCVSCDSSPSTLSMVDFQSSVRCPEFLSDAVKLCGGGCHQIGDIVANLYPDGVAVKTGRIRY